LPGIRETAKSEVFRLRPNVNVRILAFDPFVRDETLRELMARIA
jgi:hypothetical protein